VVLAQGGGIALREPFVFFKNPFRAC